MSDILIQVKRTDITGRTPNTTNVANLQYIAEGELALNMADKRLFSSNGSVLIEVGANLTSLNVTGGTTVNGALLVNNTATINTVLNVVSSLQVNSTFVANSTMIKISANDILTFNDNTTQNTAFRVYNESGTRIA